VTEVIILKTLHMFEVPFLLVGIFKYITTQFNVNLSASIYLWGFCFFKQLSAIGVLRAGMMYVTYGFKTSYLILGCTALLFTIISAFALSGKYGSYRATGGRRYRI
jgi:OHS family lactose permease-like MFS transporter